MTRTYGNEKTHLTLTDEAFAIYSDTSPLEIIEHEAEDGTYTYSMHGAIERADLSADDVNDLLESIAEEEYRTVFIPNSDDFHDMWELLLNNNYDVIADPEAHTLNIWEEQFIEADDILIENRVNHTILF